MKAVLIFSLFFPFSPLLHANGQLVVGNTALLTCDSLPPLSQLLASLDSFYLAQNRAELAEFQSSDKKNWLKFLPTLGIAYTLEGKPRPAISWSSNLLFSSFKNKEAKEAKKASILRKNELKRQRDRLKLRALLQKHSALQQDISFLKSLHKYDAQLYEVKKDQADHLEISPSELLKATQHFQKKAYEISQKERFLLDLEWDILILSHLKQLDSIRL